MRYASLIRRRETMIREIRTLRARHRKRKPLLNILIRLTVQQLKQECRRHG